MIETKIKCKACGDCDLMLEFVDNNHYCAFACRGCRFFKRLEVFDIKDCAACLSGFGKLIKDLNKEIL